MGINFPGLPFLVGFWLSSANESSVAIERTSFSLAWLSGDFKMLQWFFGNALLLVASSKISVMSSHSCKTGAL